jgi:hypothetical protein
MMALVTERLDNALQAILNPEYIHFKSYPDNAVSVAFRWMEAIHVKYAGLNLFPPVVPALAETAGQILWAALLEYGRERQPNEPVPDGLLEKSIEAYAVALASAFAPPFVGTPPVGRLDFTDAYASGYAGDNGAVAAKLATAIHRYFRSGRAVNSTNGITVNWM